jgi:cell division protein FtsQ
MQQKIVIRKVLVLVAWLLVGSGLTVLLVAANNKEQGHVCKEVRINIKGDGEQFFIDKTDINLLLNAAAGGPLEGTPLDQMDLSKLELQLERGVWIRDAELYIDSKDVLHVSAAEREPIARVFTTAGASFYIDSSGKQLPLLEKETARVLVISNFPGARKWNKKDSAMAKDVKLIAQAINASEFWKRQIAQVDITPSGAYEAIPVVGNHLIRLGTAENIDNKLSHLFLFYKQVLSKTGFDKYDIVDVQYKGQVLGVHKDGVASEIDSVQLAKNIEELLERSRQQMINDSLVQAQQNIWKVDTTAKPYVPVVIDTVRPSNPIPTKTANPNPAKSQKVKPVVPKAKPKAVMQKQR